ncbi:MAG: hypothetical protein J5718_04480 [Lachnospiraceae bacterium]|nr:hypothetical protein [Lachnospiraceae bacterium]
MRNYTGKGMNSRSFKAFWVMLLTLALIIPCMNGIKIQVRADDTAEVWKIYANGTVKQHTDVELTTGSVAGKNLIGKFISGGTYTLTASDADKLIIADNAEITENGINVADYKLSGNSSFKYNGYFLSSTPDRFQACPVSASAITADVFYNVYEKENTPYFEDTKNDVYRYPYDLTVTGNMTIAGSEEHDEEDPTITWIGQYWIGYNDITITPTGHLTIGEGGHLLVQNSLTVETGGTIEGLGEDNYLQVWDHDLRICPKATVTGLTLYKETASTAFAEDSFNGLKPDEYAFKYDSSTGKWIYPFDLDSPIFNFHIDGLDLEHESISVEYKYPNENAYRVATPALTWESTFGISLKEFPQNASSMDLRITFTPAGGSLKQINCWDIGDFKFETDGITGNVLEHEINLDEAFTNPKYSFTVSLGYPDSGNPEIVNKAAEYLYAYAGTEHEIKQYLATELYNRFIWVAMYEDFGLNYVLHDGNGDVVLDEEGNEKKDNAANINKLATRITKTGSLGTINAKDINGNSVSIPVNNYKVEWGYDQNNGNPVVSNIPVYTVPDKNSFLICTDFNKDTGTRNTFYIRKAHADEVAFDIDGEPEPDTGDLAIPVVVPSIDPEKIVVGGMGGDTAVSNSDSVYAFSFNSHWLNADQERGASQSNIDPVDYGTLVRMMIESETYVLLKGEGEEKSFGGLNINGYGTDTIFNTRTDGKAEAMVYIGHNTVHLIPLSDNTGLTVREITAVEVADESIAAGVHIDTDNMSDIKLTFDSNFYASIPLNITYSDGGTRKLTINRIGLVINYSYLKGEPNHDVDEADRMEIGFDGRDERIDVKYDYYGGEQIIVYATYYTPTNDPTGGSTDLSLYLTFKDGTHRVITADNNDTLRDGRDGTVNRGFDGRVAATNDSVATTVFLIGFALAREGQDPNDGVWFGNVTDTYYEDQGRRGFYASVLNSGWDDDNSFGGAQIGSGKGIYWDGHISWY